MRNSDVPCDEVQLWCALGFGVTGKLGVVFKCPKHLS